MEKTNIKSFEETDPVKLCDKVNEFGKTNNVFATQTMSHLGKLVAFVYFKSI